MNNSDLFSWDDKPDLNITPLVDVMLVLIAILMLTTPLIMYEEKIALAKGSKQEQYKKSDSIEIRVDKKKNIYLNDDIYTYQSFADSFILFAASYPQRAPKILIRADKDLKYKDVMYILKTVKSAKFKKVSLVTDG
jgi:biopolymer transport protein ExbD